MKPVLVVGAAILGTLALVVGLAFMYGTPQAPAPAALAAGAGAPPQAAAMGAPPAGMGAPTAGGAVTGAAEGGGEVPITENAQVPEPDPSVPLAIEIPGCTCHSDDPKIVEEHSTYRMNQCAGCHAGETPTGM